MSNVPGSARAVLVYALILPLALVLGYVLANPMTVSSAGTVMIVLSVLALPLALNTLTFREAQDGQNGRGGK